MKRIVVPLLICGLMIPCAHAAPVEVNNPSQQVQEQKRSVDLSSAISEFNKADMRVTVAGVSGLEGIATVGGYDGDMVSPLTTAMSLSFVASESDGNSMVSPYKDGERLHHTMTLGTAAQKAITNAIPAEYSLSQSSTPEGAMKVAKEFGSLEPSTTLMVNMLTASHRASGDKKVDPAKRDIFKGVTSGFMEGSQEGDIVVAFKNAPTGVSPYVINHKAHREGEVEDDDEERNGNGHTMVSGYLISESVTLAVSMVVPDDQVEVQTTALVKALTPYMGVGESEPEDSESAPSQEVEPSVEPEIDAPGHDVEEEKSAFA